MICTMNGFIQYMIKYFIGEFNNVKYILNQQEYDEYVYLKNKNNPVRKIKYGNHMLCPVCKYVVDNLVPCQKYCDRCGQKLK